MYEFLILLKKEAKLLLQIDKIRKNKIYKNILLSIFLIYILFSIGVSSFMYSKITFDYLAKMNLEIYVIIIFSILSTFSIFLFTTYSSKAKLFNNNDNNLLFSLPINSKNILLSRFFNIYIMNLFFNIIIMIPALIIYGLNTNINTIFIFNSIVISILIPIIPSIVASLFGFIISYFTSRVKSKNLFEILFSFLLIFSIYILIYNAQDILQIITKDPQKIENILKYFFYNIYLISDIIFKNNLISLAKYIFINILSLSIFIYIMNLYFKKIIFKLSEETTNDKNEIGKLKENSILKSLIKKEIKRYFSSPIYVLNTSFGIVMFFILSIFTIFIERNKILGIIGYESLNFSIFQILFIAILLISFLSNTTNSSISIEGKNFWIIKTLPIKYKNIFIAKILLNLIIIIPIMVISLIIMKFTLDFKYLELIILLIFVILFSIVSAAFGLLINLKFPKMDAINDIQIVKQSLSVIITVLVPLLTFIMFTSIYIKYLKNINFYLILVSIFVLFIIFLITEIILLKKYGYKRLKEI